MRLDGFDAVMEEERVDERGLTSDCVSGGEVRVVLERNGSRFLSVFARMCALSLCTVCVDVVGETRQLERAWIHAERSFSD